MRTPEQKAALKQLRENRVNHLNRKSDTRKKIILGGAILAQVNENIALREMVLSVLDGVDRKADIELAEELAKDIRNGE